MTAATNTPLQTASARPTRASPRISTRTRQSRRDVDRPVTIQAASRDGAVMRPSNRWVTASTGIRSNEGNSPK